MGMNEHSQLYLETNIYNHRHRHQQHHPQCPISTNQSIIVKYPGVKPNTTALTSCNHPTVLPLQTLKPLPTVLAHPYRLHPPTIKMANTENCHNHPTTTTPTTNPNPKNKPHSSHKHSSYPSHSSPYGHRKTSWHPTSHKWQTTSISHPINVTYTSAPTSHSPPASYPYPYPPSSDSSPTSYPPAKDYSQAPYSWEASRPSEQPPPPPTHNSTFADSYAEDV